jgi:hypothetical protein
LQFHLEIETRHVEAWSGSAGGGRELDEFGIRRSELLAELDERLPVQLAAADRAFSAFATLVNDRAACQLDRCVHLSRGPIERYDRVK